MRLRKILFDPIHIYKEAKLDSTIMACDFYYIKIYYMHVHAIISKLYIIVDTRISLKSKSVIYGAHPCADSDFFSKMGSPGIICNF